MAEARLADMDSLVDQLENRQLHSSDGVTENGHTLTQESVNTQESVGTQDNVGTQESTDTQESVDTRVSIDAQKSVNTPESVGTQESTDTPENIDTQKYLDLSDTDLTHEEIASHIVFLGEVGAGKTSLVNTLADVEMEDPTNTTQTKGVDCEKKLSVFVNTDSRKYKEVSLQCVDFGGHESYHLMQQFFLSVSTLYILVVDIFRFAASDYYKKVGYWLDMLKAQTVNPTVCLVASHIDELGENQSPQEHEKETLTKLGKIIKNLGKCEKEDLKALERDLKKCRVERDEQQAKVDRLSNTDARDKRLEESELGKLNSRMKRIETWIKNRPTLPKHTGDIFCINSKEKDEEKSGRKKLRSHIEKLIISDCSKFCEPYIVGTQCDDIERIVLGPHEEQNFFKLEDIITQVCHEPYNAHRSKEEVLVDVKWDLEYLNKKGSIIYKLEYPGYIFHDKQWLNEVMVAIFSHDKCSDDWNPLNEEQFEDEIPDGRELTHMFRKKNSSGVIYEKFLKCMLAGLKYFKESDFEVIINLLKVLEFCYEIEQTDTVLLTYKYANDENRLFAFPYLLKVQTSRKSGNEEELLRYSSKTVLTEEMDRLWKVPTPQTCEGPEVQRMVGKKEYALVFQVTPGFRPVGVYERFSVNLNYYVAHRIDNENTVVARFKHSQKDDVVCVMEYFDVQNRETVFFVATQVVAHLLQAKICIFCTKSF